MPYIDQSGLFVLEDTIIDLIQKGKTVLFVGILQQPEYMLERVELIPNLVPRNQIFKTFDECLSWIKKI